MIRTFLFTLFPKPYLILGFLLLPIPFFISCSLRTQALDKLSQRTQALEDYKNSDREGAHAERLLSWAEAKALLVENNQTLKKGRRQVTQAADRRKKYWRSYIPGVQAAANLNRGLGELDGISLNDINLSAFLRLRVPNPISVPGEVQVLVLNEYMAEKRYIQQERQLIVNLYRIFLQAKQLDAQVEELLVLTPGRQELSTSNELISAIQTEESNRRGLAGLMERKRGMQRNLASLLDSENHAMRMDYHSLPSLGYRSLRRDLSQEQSYGRLALQILAGNLELARLRVQKVKLSRLPSFNVNAASPQLYSSNAGGGDFDVEAISLFMGMSDSISWNSNEREQTRVSEENYELAIKNAKSAIREDQETLQRAQKRLEELVSDLGEAQKKRKLLKSYIRSDLAVETLQTALNQIINIDKLILATENNIITQELQFWLWDEKKW